MFMYPFSVRYFVKQHAMTEKIFPSTFRGDIGRNWFISVEFCSVGNINSLSSHPLFTDLLVTPCSPENFVQPS